MNHNAGSCLTVKFAPAEETDAGLQSFAEDFFEVVAFDYMDMLFYRTIKLKC